MGILKHKTILKRKVLGLSVPDYDAKCGFWTITLNYFVFSVSLKFLIIKMQARQQVIESIISCKD